MLNQKIFDKLERPYGEHANAPFNTLAEIDPSVRSITAEILGVPYIGTKEEFEQSYVADFLKHDDESDGEYENRLSKLNERRFITAIDLKTEQKIIFVTDPTRPELDEYCHLSYGVISEEAYKEIIGIASDLSLAFDENESMPSYIRRLLRYSFDQRANDIDLVSMQATVAIKLKISGEWEKIGALPIAYKNKFISALCSMASPNPVDFKSGGRLRFRVSTSIDGIDLSYRISTMPNAFGEKVAIRKLPGVGAFPRLEDLGLSPEALDVIDSWISQIDLPTKGGLIILTGETGSGKSTLLSAIEGEYIKKQKMVCTSEDPVENRFPHPFLSQTEVGDDAGMTHMDALIDFMRQNSDVIVIGESLEAPELGAVVNAGLTGHFTYTTFHTGSNKGTFLRLQAMGIDLNLLSGVLKGIGSLNLRSMLCSSCKVPIGAGRYVRGNGCEQCRGRGINGVVPVGEFSTFDDETRGMIGTASPEQIMQAVVKSGKYISMESQVDRLIDLGVIDAGVTCV